MREILAAWHHEQWSGWMRHVFSNSVFESDSTWTMPAHEIERRRCLIDTPYSKLSEQMRDKDREQADKLLVVLSDAS